MAGIHSTKERKRDSEQVKKRPRKKGGIKYTHPKQKETRIDTTNQRNKRTNKRTRK